MSISQIGQLSYRVAKVSRGTMSQKLNSFPAAPGQALSGHSLPLQKNGIWRKLPVLLLSSRKMKTFSLVPGSFTAPTVLYWKSQLTGLPPAKLFISLRAEMHLPSVQQDLHQETLAFIHNTCHSLDTEFIKAVVGSGGL